MKKKQKLEKFFSSVFGSHVDHEDSHRLPNKEDVEKDVERILEILRSEESGHHSTDRSELAFRLESFHKGYQDIHGRYNNLMGKVTKKFRRKSNDNGSFSLDFSSSDSDSSESGSEEKSHKKSNKIRENNPDQVPVEDYYTLQRQLESANIKITELETRTTAMSMKLEEDQALKAILEEQEALVITLRSELQTMSDGYQTLQAEKDVLLIEVETLLGKRDETNQSLTKLQEENENLRLEHAEAFRKIHDMEKAIEKFDAELEQVKYEKEKADSENEGLKVELERTANQVADLTQQLATSSENNNSLRSGNTMFLNRIQEAERALADFRDQAEQNLKLVTDEHENLKSRLEAADKQNFVLLERFSAAEGEISSLKAEILSSASQIRESKEIIEAMKAENLKLMNENKDLSELLTVKAVETDALESKYVETVETKKQTEEEVSVLAKDIEKLKGENSELLANYSSMELALQEAKNSFSELKLLLEAAENDKQSLVAENSALTDKIQQVEMAIDQLGVENSELQIKLNDSSLELHTANDRSAELEKAVDAVEEEKKILILESSSVLYKLEEAEVRIQQLLEELEILRKNNSMLQFKLQETENVIVDLKAEIENLTVDNSHLKTNASNMGLDLEAASLQITDLSAKLEQQREETSTLEHNHNDLQTQKRDLEVRLDEKLAEISSLQAKLDEVREEADNRIKSFTEQVDSIERERDLLNNQKSEMEENIASLTSTSLEDQETIRNMQEELKSQKDSFDELLSNYKKLDATYQETLQKLEFTERKLEELGTIDETIQTVEAVNENQKNEISKLEETRMELSEKLEMIEAEKADADREIVRLHKHVQNLEVQIRLSNQKLKITETENKETEESYKKTIEALREECRVLEGKLGGVSGNFGVIEKELRQIKQLVTTDISALANGYQELESMFKEKSAHLPYQISECNKELKLLKNRFELLKNEKRDLSAKLQYSEGIVDKLAKTEQELAILRTKEDESEKRIKALEEMLREKKREVSDKDEAKREAIRQLCLLIEYHRENCVHLSQYLASTHKKGVRSSS